MIDGFEYCGNHSYCVNNDDDTRGLTCECESGYTSHRIYFGEAVELRVTMQKSKLFRLGCRDLDECSEGGSQCGVNTDCYNTDGDHECVCKIGFEGSPSTGHKFVLNFFLTILKSSVSGCTDIDECQYFNDPFMTMGPLGSLNISYSYPTFRNLPEDQRTWSFYEPQPCPQGDACINVFYQDGKGFKCVPSDQTFAAVIIGGLDWNQEAEVLKADLTRCDGAIPSYHKMIYHHRVS